MPPCCEAGNYGTTDTYRYATLNGVQLALPTTNGGAAYPNGIGTYQPGTAIDNNPIGETNPTYDGLLAIWDGYNGTGTGTSINGTPSGWQANGYWSATPSALGHAFVGLFNGLVYDYYDTYDIYVALQVLFPDTTAPTVTGIAITSATGIQNSTLNAGDVVSATVTLSEATTVTGTPQLALDIGGTTVQANYASGSGTTALVFTYTILSGQADAGGIGIAADSLTLNGGTLADAAGNNATLTHALVADNGSYKVDTATPVFSSGTSANFAENSTTAYDATADGDSGVAYAIGGTDAALFGINTATGAVTFTTNPNYEAPADNGGNNVYDITVTATDAAGNAANQAVALTVTGTNIYGTPSGWLDSRYWSATPSAHGHAGVDLYVGSVGDYYAYNGLYVALQVLFPDTTAPTVSSVVITSATGIQGRK